MSPRCELVSHLLPWWWDVWHLKCFEKVHRSHFYVSMSKLSRHKKINKNILWRRNKVCQTQRTSFRLIWVFPVIWFKHVRRRASASRKTKQVTEGKNAKLRGKRCVCVCEVISGKCLAQFQFKWKENISRGEYDDGAPSWLRSRWLWTTKSTVWVRPGAFVALSLSTITPYHFGNREGIKNGYLTLHQQVKSSLGSTWSRVTETKLGQINDN